MATAAAKTKTKKNLVIVESPSKAKTIKGYLGKSYSVLASNGHVRDLPKSQLGIDIKNNFEPKYITIRGKGDLLNKLKKEAKAAGLPGRIIPLPTQISAGCGLSWRAFPEDKDKLESFMKERGIDYSSLVVIDAPLRRR